jgi:dihydroorotate dehydrogenase electron transfer subunit
MKYSKLVKIEKVTHLTENIFSLQIHFPEIAMIAKPGQFIQLKLNDYSDKLWPRPFSIHSTNNTTITLSIKICGKVTNKLAQLQKGDKVNITGPLGEGFTMPSDSKQIFIIAGGVGLPPLHFLSNVLIKNNFSAKHIHFFSGAKNTNELFANDEIQSLGVNYILTTDDGSAGVKGFITEPLKEKLSEFKNADIDQKPIIYSCGPMVMLKKVAEICSDFECYVSLEQLMPCGWGVCNGCAVKIIDKNKANVEDERGFRLARVCKEGPVFKASEILWE